MIDRVFPGENTGSRGTADLAGGISTGELHSLVGNPVDVWTFIKTGAFIAEIMCSHIINKNKDHIGIGSSRANDFGKKKEACGNKYLLHIPVFILRPFEWQ